jgi:hypothetical protein
MTVEEFKKLVSEWPDQDADGNAFEVWMETGIEKSSKVETVVRLNVGDILIRPGSGAWHEWPEYD